MSRLIWTAATAAACLLGAREVTAQSLRQKDQDRSKSEIPRSLMPPPGMCRIWVDNVPAGQQPAPTDCASAIRNRPQHGRVIFADDSRGEQKGKDRDRDGKREKGRKP